MASKVEKQRWDPYETSQRRAFIYWPNSTSEVLLSPVSTSFIDSFSQSGPFGSTVYHQDYSWKTACKAECIRAATASGHRRNNPHPSKSFMMWRLPRDVTRSSEYVSLPGKCSTSEREICKALTAQYRSTYTCDFMGTPQEKGLEPLHNKHRVPISMDTEMRDSYRRPKQRPDVLLSYCHFPSNMDRDKACCGIVPTVVQRCTQQKGPELTTYEGFHGKTATNLSNRTKSLLPQDEQHLCRPEQEKEAAKTVLIRPSHSSSRDKIHKLPSVVMNSCSPDWISKWPAPF